MHPPSVGGRADWALERFPLHRLHRSSTRLSCDAALGGCPSSACWVKRPGTAPQRAGTSLILRVRSIAKRAGTCLALSSLSVATIVQGKLSTKEWESSASPVLTWLSLLCSLCSPQGRSYDRVGPLMTSGAKMGFGRMSVRM